MDPVHALDNQIVVKTIFDHLELKDICRLALTCKAWSNAARDPEYWVDIDLSHRTVPTEVLRRLLLRHSHVVRLNAGYLGELNIVHMQDVFQNLNRLEYLLLEKDTVLPAELDVLAGLLPRLKTLEIHSTVFETHDDPDAAHVPPAQQQQPQQPQALLHLAPAPPPPHLPLAPPHHQERHISPTPP